jgi:hypothetical protein
VSIPARIGRYRVERWLGAGAFATVWLAEDDVLQSWVAIKVLADNWTHHPDVRVRFEQETQILRRTGSERLVRIHDFGELPDGRPYQVMTYAAGGTLAERLAEGPMPVLAALRTAAAIARATVDLHEAGVDVGVGRRLDCGGGLDGETAGLPSPADGGAGTTGRAVTGPAEPSTRGTAGSHPAVRTAAGRRRDERKTATRMTVLPGSATSLVLLCDAVRWNAVRANAVTRR